MTDSTGKIMIYDTMSEEMKEFQPLKPGHVSMYVCGPTVYDTTHIGHARASVAFDVVRRYLRHCDLKVKFIHNFTDVDDKIINRAKETGEVWNAISERFSEDYLKVLKALNITDADVYPKCSTHIPEMIELINRLLSKDIAYVVDQDVFFDTSKFESYGRLSKRSLDDETVARLEPDPRKRHAADFALWKAAKPGEPFWDSPWGHGRPGWHIECSAMSIKYLGETFDIHAGGLDLIFPHHENEIAQASAATGKPFANYWMHNGMITVGGKKMSKSLKNIISVWDALKKHSAESLRALYLGAHYRSPIDFTWEKLAGCENGLKRLYQTLDRSRQALSGKVNVPANAPEDLEKSKQAAGENFYAAMNNDFNTAGALGAVYELAGSINKFFREGESGALNDAQKKVLADCLTQIENQLEVFGLPKEMKSETAVSPEVVNALSALVKTLQGGAFADALKKDASDRMSAVESKLTSNSAEEISQAVGVLMELIIAFRKQARADKNWPAADQIRGELTKLKITLTDSPSGTTWRAE